MTYSCRILSGVSQQLLVHVNTNTFPYSIGHGSPLTKVNFGIRVDRIWISQRSSLPQLWHFGIDSANGAISIGNELREYLKSQSNVNSHRCMSIIAAHLPDDLTRILLNSFQIIVKHHIAMDWYSFFVFLIGFATHWICATRSHVSWAAWALADL